MTTRGIEDPIRWRDLSTSHVRNTTSLPKTIECEIGETAQRLATMLPPDDLRLAQIRRRLTPLLPQSGARAPRVLRPSIQIALLLIASMGLGGVATAVTGRFLGWRRATGTTLTPGLTATLTTAEGRETRRWRVAVDTPAKLDLIVGPEGTALAVREGRAEITPADPGDGARVVVPPGSPGREAERDFVPPHESVLPGPQPLPPKAWPPDPLPATPGSLTAPAPARGKKEASDDRARMPVPRARAHHDLDRAIAVSALALAETEEPTAQRKNRDSVVPPNATVEGAAVTPPRFEPPVRPAVPASVLAGPIAAAGPVPSRMSVSAPLHRGTAALPPQLGLESSNEAAMLVLAFRRLRTEHDPLAALALIDEHDRRFGRRGLAREAALARAEALLALGRSGAALGVLDELSLSGSSIDRRAALARAELRAAKDRTSDAIRDFDVVLQGGLDDQLGARALYGRAVVRGAAGDAAGARDDLREYLKRFSAGPRRGDAMAMLRGLGG